MASVMSLPARHQPGQSTTQRKVRLLPTSSAISTRSWCMARGYRGLDGRSGVPAEEQEGRVVATLVFDVDRRAGLDVDEAGVAGQFDEAVPVEPEVVDPFGLGAVEGAVLAVEI